MTVGRSKFPGICLIIVTRIWFPWKFPDIFVIIVISLISLQVIPMTSLTWQKQCTLGAPWHRIVAKWPFRLKSLPGSQEVYVLNCIKLSNFALIYLILDMWRGILPDRVEWRKLVSNACAKIDNDRKEDNKRNRQKRHQKHQKKWLSVFLNFSWIFLHSHILCYDRVGFLGSIYLIQPLWITINFFCITHFYKKIIFAQCWNFLSFFMIIQYENSPKTI